MFEVRILPGSQLPCHAVSCEHFQGTPPFHKKCRVRDSRLSAINEDDTTWAVSLLGCWWASSLGVFQLFVFLPLFLLGMLSASVVAQLILCNGAPCRG